MKRQLAFGFTAAAVAAPLLVAAPAAHADSACLKAWNGAAGENAVYVSNDCMSSVIGASVDVTGFDAPCTQIEGRFTNGRQEPQVLRFPTKGYATAADAYECWVW